MHDVQSSPGTSTFVINSVGVTSLAYPFTADVGDGAPQPVVGQWTFGVTLPAERRGTHMSRFITNLDEVQTQPISLDRHYKFAEQLLERLEAESGYVETKFSWFRRVEAPVTKLAGFLNCEVSFRSEPGHDPLKSVKVQLAATALCPCSKAVSDRGAHNQRSDIEVTATYRPERAPASLAQLVEIAESGASARVYPILKRLDEKYVTEQAYDHPAFVEDIVRQIAARLGKLPGIKRFSVEAINRESIHSHDCFARIEHTLPT